MMLLPLFVTPASSLSRGPWYSKTIWIPIKDSGNDGYVDASQNFRHDKKRSLGERDGLESLRGER